MTAQFTQHQNQQKRVRSEMQSLSATFEALQEEKQQALVCDSHCC